VKAAFITVALVALVALAVPVLADDPDVETYAAPLDAQSDPTQIRVKTPLQQAIADIQDRAIEQVQLLHAQLLSRAPGSAEAREMDLRIRTTKQDTEVAILRVILADAIDRDDLRTKAGVELALDHILHPENHPIQTFPSNRPAPESK
jgi:hypothetical protein